MLQGEEAYQNFERVIENANVIMATYADELMGDCQVSSQRKRVADTAHCRHVRRHCTASHGGTWAMLASANGHVLDDDGVGCRLGRR